MALRDRCEELGAPLLLPGIALRSAAPLQLVSTPPSTGSVVPVT